MPKSQKAPTRRPAKAKGTLPAPRITERRSRAPWYRQRGFQAIGAIVVLGLIGLGIQQFVASRHRSAGREQTKRAVRRFEQKVTRLQAPLVSTVQGMQSAPEDLKSGKITPDEFKSQADGWLKAFRKFSDELRKSSVPPGLQDARAQLLQATVTFIDAVRSFQLAATTDGAVRDQAIELGRNLLAHAGTAYGNAGRAIDVQMRLVGLRSSETPAQPPSLPVEEAPPPPSPPPATAPLPTAPPQPARSG